jgi:hypothetical protein
VFRGEEGSRLKVQGSRPDQFPFSFFTLHHSPLIIHNSSFIIPRSSFPKPIPCPYEKDEPSPPFLAIGQNYNFQSVFWAWF